MNSARIAEQQLAAVKAREAVWLAATGLRKSSARLTAALRWLDAYRYPHGFDHTGVYYSPTGRFHVILTEPYHSTERAILSIEAMAQKRGGAYSWAVGQAGTGLWFPGPCVALLVGPVQCDSAIGWFASELPSVPTSSPKVV